MEDKDQAELGSSKKEHWNHDEDGNGDDGVCDVDGIKFSKNREKYKKIVKIPKKLKMNLVLCIVWYIFFSDFIFDVLIFKKIFF